MTGPNWDSFRDTVRDAHSNQFDFDEIDVVNFSGGYDPETGETDDWSEKTPYPTVDAEVTTPNEPAETTGPDGQQTTVSRRVRIRDDTGETIHPIGTENYRPTELDIHGTRYVVAEQLHSGDGLLTLLVVET